MTTLAAERATALARLAELARARLIPTVDAFRVRQSHTGAIAEPGEHDRAMLDEILHAASPLLRQIGAERQLAALERDVATWLDAGLDTAPYFDGTRDAFAVPGNEEPCLFVGPVLTTNGPTPVGRRFEVCLALREEPAECDVAAASFPHPKNKCQSTRLLAASGGFRTGNCIVLFPENVAAATKVRTQSYAVFFFNKFHRIYLEETIPAARRLLGGFGTGREAGWASMNLDAEQCYRARCVWGYLHDYYHHQGPRPFDEHIDVKLNWFVGLLEEIKVDAQTAITCDAGVVPLGREQVEFILLERLFRYPLHPAATANFDSGTGVFLYSWLRERGALTRTEDGRLQLHWPRAIRALDELVTEIEALEVSVRDDADWRARAKQFVRRYLPEGEPGTRFRFTDDQATLLAPFRSHPGVLDFAGITY